MNAQTLLTELDAAGVTLTLTASSLRYKGPMTPALRAALVANKTGIRELLQARHTPKSRQPATIPQENGSQSVEHLPGYLDLAARLSLTGDLPDADLIGDIEAAMDEHLSIMAAATGCSDAQADKMLVQFDRLTALYGLALGVATRPPTPASPPVTTGAGDPPPASACFNGATHRRYWRRPEVSGWVCSMCHPPADGLEVETYTVPGDGQPLPHLVGKGVYQEALL